MTMVVDENDVLMKMRCVVNKREEIY